MYRHTADTPLATLELDFVSTSANARKRGTRRTAERGTATCEIARPTRLIDALIRRLHSQLLTLVGYARRTREYNIYAGRDRRLRIRFRDTRNYDCVQARSTPCCARSPTTRPNDVYESDRQRDTALEKGLTITTTGTREQHLFIHKFTRDANVRLTSTRPLVTSNPTCRETRARNEHSRMRVTSYALNTRDI